MAGTGQPGNGCPFFLPGNRLFYTAPLAPGTSLDDIFTRFNIDHPKDFKGHSLSVSDVVVLHQDGQDTAHYVDRGDFKQIPEFLQEKQPQRESPLKAAEQTTEQNYNMIDGRINNTPTVDELEAKVKAGETICYSEFDLHRPFPAVHAFMLLSVF